MYDYKKIENKWNKSLKKSYPSMTQVDYTKKKFYILVDMLHPSRNKLHLGHIRSWITADVIARKKRIEGYNVLFPVGWDCFGYAPEVFAKQNNSEPKLILKNNIKSITEQFDQLGISYNKNRVIDTSSPDYYKWTQWIFLKLYDKGLVKRSKKEITWCEECKKHLTSEESVDNTCKYCSNKVDNHIIDEWAIDISKYSDKLINNLDKTNYSNSAKKEMTNWLKGTNVYLDKNAKSITTDWSFSRQRYWGEPIPLIYCKKCGIVKDDNLPIILPNYKNYILNNYLENPLDYFDNWKKTICPVCKKESLRETSVMTNWASSSWYYLRLIDPDNTNELANMESLKYWGKVDCYIGMKAQVTRHLIYARFINNFLYDNGYVIEEEPFDKRLFCGVVLNANLEKFSRVKQNGGSITETIDNYGVDALRLAEISLGKFENELKWDNQLLNESSNLLNQIWNIKDTLVDSNDTTVTYETIIECIYKINKAIDEYELYKIKIEIHNILKAIRNYKKINISMFLEILIALNPILPYITEELNRSIGNKQTIFEYVNNKGGSIDE